MKLDFFVVLFSIVILGTSCKKDNPPVSYEEDYFILNEKYYHTPNAYIIPVDTFYAFSLYYFYLTDGEIDASGTSLKSYNQAVFFELNTHPADSFKHNFFTEWQNNTRLPNTFSQAEFLFAKNNTILDAKEGLIEIQNTDTSFVIDYHLKINEDTTIVGNFKGEPKFILL